MKKAILILVALILVPFLGGSAMLGYVAAEVFYGDDSYLDKQKIVEILSKESVVFYSDGQSQLGSLFGQEHRHYVSFHEMPKTLLDAVVAAEDDRFYHHFGVDALSTGRAAFRNILFGKHEGASTITQQTVKNLYGRKTVNLLVKLQEAINAFKLERKYSKQEILEFYLNQFHVAGNGRGVGIASKYYFNKEVSELTLTEAAFIAGSVKGPDRYTPFTKRSSQAQAKARLDAKNRKNYVVRRMFELGLIDKNAFEISRDEEVPFRQGRFQFNELSVIDLVQRQLSRREILSALGVDAVDQLGTMGLRITTTLEKNVQTGAQYGVRQNLSRLEMILSGFQTEPATNFMNIQLPEPFSFYVAQIKEIKNTPKAESVLLSFGVPECTVPADGVERVATYLDRALGRGTAKAKADFLASLKTGDYVLASVRASDPKSGTLACDIERRPKIQGGLIVLDKGRVVAMVGGFAPYEYNRAFFAKRQPGSTFKTLTYFPALQLGWSALDALPNSRAVHQWQGQFYFPRPDHLPETLETTLAGAGAKSENLSSVWLLRHLTSRLSFEQFLELLHALGYYEDGETGEAVLARIARKFNVRLLDSHLRGGAFETALADLLMDISIASKPQTKALLSMMNFGANHDSEAAIEAATKKDLTPKEVSIRTQVLRNNFLRWEALAAEARRDLTLLRETVEGGGGIPETLRTRLGRFRITADGSALAYLSDTPFLPGEVTPLLTNPEFKPVSGESLVSELDLNRALLEEPKLLLDGVLNLDLINAIQSETEEKFKAVKAAPVLEQLYIHDDFRYSIGMMYAQRMCKEMGIESEIQWVPSYPLGANVVTLTELAGAYQTLLQGKSYRFFDEGSENQVLVIERIEDMNGQLLWEPETTAHQLFDEFYSPSILSILRGTVTHGTAYAAHSAVVLSAKDAEAEALLAKSPIRIPTFGKTGTTNDYVNATYVGFLPYPPGDGTKELTAENAYTIAAYVGYDTNEPMKRRAFKVAGGTGALPAWIEAARALIRETDFARKLDWKALLEKKVAEVPFDYGSSLARFRASLHSAIIADASAPEDSEESADANTYNDYSVQKKGFFNMALPGDVSGGVFTPKRKVALFTPRSAMVEQITDEKSQKEISAEVEGVSGTPPTGQKPQGTPSAMETPFQAPRLPDESAGQDEDPTETIPPAPAVTP